jgi:L-ascorbate metabolism protein UlaG (beta-lactamase superfamily)
MDEALKISWYGRCCFLLEHKDTKVLLDPYDSFCQVDIGTINADLVVISSTWHDHGHIGASPKAHVYSYPGQYDHNGIKITGIGAKEERGSPTTVFNIRMGGFSVTNFADFHSKEKTQFDHSLSTTQIEVLQSSNIIFARPSIVGNKITDNNIHNESFLEFCSPAMIIPEHYFPKEFH